MGVCSKAFLSLAAAFPVSKTFGHSKPHDETPPAQPAGETLPSSHACGHSSRPPIQ